MEATGGAYTYMKVDYTCQSFVPGERLAGEEEGEWGETYVEGTLPTVPVVCQKTGARWRAIGNAKKSGFYYTQSSWFNSRCGINLIPRLWAMMV